MVRHALEHREEFRRIERFAGNAGDDLYAPGAELIDRAIHLLERGLRVVHRYRGDERREFLRILLAHLGHAVVRHARELGRLRRIAEQLRARQAEGDHLLHVGELLAQHRHAMLDVPQHAQVRHPLHHAGLLRVGFHQLEIRHRHDVIEDVDLHARIVLSTRSRDARWVAEGA